jgi:prenyltransferase beta subunit
MHKRNVGLVFGVFLISLLLSTFLTQAFTGTFTESRRSVLISALESAQVPGVGGFHCFYNSTDLGYVDASGTADVLLALKILGAVDQVNEDAALKYISTNQDPQGGGYGVYYENGTLLQDLASTYFVVNDLKALDAVDMINRTLLIDFVLNRYNSSTGAFHEPITNVDGESFAECAFSLEFTNALADVAYAVPNVISTFLAVSILKDVDALNLINVTRTLDWVLSDQASDGGFKPYPFAEPEILPGWSSLIQNPFDVAGDGAGIPYTYAAVGILKALGFTYLLNMEEVRNYILACQTEDGRFTIYEDDPFSNILPYTYYAIVGLSNIDMLNRTSESASKVNDVILGDQLLALDNQWPVQMPQLPPHTQYGLFIDQEDPLEDTVLAVQCLNVTGALSLLNQSTPRVYASLLNLMELSALISGLLLLVLLVIPKVRKATAPKTDDYETSTSATQVEKARAPKSLLQRNTS